MQGSSRPDRQLLDAAAFCSHLVKEGSVHAFLAEHRATVFPDSMFEDLFPSGRGRPSVPAEVIATVMVLQALECLSDREACEKLRTSISWKVAAGLPLDDEGFHPTVLVLWRNKLRASDRPERIFEAVRAVVESSGVLAKKNRRALDSTVLDDAVQRQDASTLITSQMRRVRKLVPELRDKVYVREHNLLSGRPPCDFEDQDDIDRLISELVEDANELVFSVERLGLELDEVQEDAVALLALVAGQDVEPGDRPGRWRIAERTAPDRVLSTVDPESRHAHKTQRSYRDGYKAHLAAEPTTGIVTAAEITAGNTADGEVALDLLEEEPEGTVVLADSAYGSGELRSDLEGAGFQPVIKPLPLRPAVEGGFTLDDFEIDEAESTITCPAGVTVKDQRQPAGPLREELRHLPDAKALHQVQGRAHDRPQREPRPPRRGQDPVHDDRVPARVPHLPPDDRALHRLARARPVPPASLHRHRAQPDLALGTGCRPQPPAPRQPRPHP